MKFDVALEETTIVGEAAYAVRPNKSIDDAFCVMLFHFHLLAAMEHLLAAQKARAAQGATTKNLICYLNLEAVGAIDPQAVLSIRGFVRGLYDRGIPVLVACGPPTLEVLAVALV